MAEAALRLNALSIDEARRALAACCGSSRWVEGMLARRPFESRAALLSAADSVWRELGPDDFLEAFRAHPEIGADVAALRAKFEHTAALSEGEQARVAEADEPTLLALRDGNRDYRARFGHIFIVCASGKSAGEMLALLRARLSNDPAEELRVAAAEQAKITRLRLEKLES